MARLWRGIELGSGAREGNRQNEWVEGWVLAQDGTFWHDVRKVRDNDGWLHHRDLSRWGLRAVSWAEEFFRLRCRPSAAIS